MILIKLQKITSNQNTVYSIVVCSNKIAPVRGKIIEKIGFYKPVFDKLSNKYFFIDFDRLSFWLKRGAKLNISLFVLIKPIFLIFSNNK